MTAARGSAGSDSRGGRQVVALDDDLRRPKSRISNGRGAVAGVVGDAVQPRPEARGTPEPWQRTKRLEVGLLEHLVHAIAVAEQTERQRPEAWS